ncbi:type I secretion system permease/ATPase [Ramlibacter sp. AW1]|uniref:Cyclolysin secretion/processing ATP-binding protein CyaB n=1 Tax=Ramlibacter aurantiacus TaxID=2801330 RepID=A0A936ZIH5_9BURK|nr:type I secretion system permease/ATPase [Ramlibacter aurantiacus]MBL0420467.1 type I secretion system permease/ATPase [Ramlibacter aurantiacus]
MDTTDTTMSAEGGPTGPPVNPDDPAGDNLRLIALFAQTQGLHPSSDDMARHAAPAGNENADPALATALRVLEALGLTVRVQTGSLKALLESRSACISADASGRLMMLAPVANGGLLVRRAGELQAQALDAHQARTQLSPHWQGRWLRVRAAAPAGGASGGAFGLPWFLQALAPHKRLLAEVLMASLFIQALALVSPLVFQVVIDKVLTHRSLATLDVLVLALLATTLFEALLSTMRLYLLGHTSHRLDVQLGAGLFSRLLALPLSYFASRRSGDTVARVRELENVRSFLTGQGLTSWMDLAFVVVFLAVMASFSLPLTAVVLGALPILFGVSLVITPLMRRRLEGKFAAGAESQSFLAETAGAMEALKSQAVEAQWQREWERRLADQAQASFHSNQFAQASAQLTGLLGKVLTALLLWFGARLVIQGDLSVGGLIAFNMLAARVQAPILKLASLWQEFAQVKVSIRRLSDVMDAPPEPGLQPARSSAPPLTGRLRLDGVSFRYGPNQPEVLKDLSLEIAPGEIIGMVGTSGAGKTTLLRLLQRLYTPERGRVLIDGMDLSQCDPAWLRRQLGVVSQDAVLFHRSVRDNIALGRPELPLEDVWRAARLAGAHDFIVGLPQGYDTLVGERGSCLSGGQRSRIAIARALAHDPRVLLLDEATAALDYDSERAFHANLGRMAAGRTVLIVAHRLSTLRLAHRIAVLDRGRLVQCGPHALLAAQAGPYRHLWQLHQMTQRQEAFPGVAPASSAMQAAAAGRADPAVCES